VDDLPVIDLSNMRDYKMRNSGITLGAGYVTQGTADL
jgi:hypothetical protein